MGDLGRRIVWPLMRLSFVDICTDLPLSLPHINDHWGVGTGNIPISIEEGKKTMDICPYVCLMVTFVR